MSDLYLEELIKKKETGKDKLIRYGLMAVTFVLLVLSFLTWSMMFIFPAIVVCVVDIFVFPRLRVEWEYQYVNGELDIDKIMNKSKRKRMASYDVDGVEIVALAVSHRLDYYNNNPKLKVRDFTSCDPAKEKSVYAMVLSNEGELNKVLFEPSEAMLKDMRSKAPRKVFFD